MIGKDGVELASLRHHLAAFERIGDRNEEAARGGQVRRPNHVGIGGIADDRLPRPCALEGGNPVGIILDHQQRVSAGNAALTKLPTRPWPTSTTWSVNG